MGAQNRSVRAEGAVFVRGVDRSRIATTVAAEGPLLAITAAPWAPKDANGRGWPVGEISPTRAAWRPWGAVPFPGSSRPRGAAPSPRAYFEPRAGTGLVAPVLNEDGRARFQSVACEGAREQARGCGERCLGIGARGEWARGSWGRRKPKRVRCDITAPGRNDGLSGTESGVPRALTVSLRSQDDIAARGFLGTTFFEVWAPTGHWGVSYIARMAAFPVP